MMLRAYVRRQMWQAKLVANELAKVLVGSGEKGKPGTTGKTGKPGRGKGQTAERVPAAKALRMMGIAPPTSQGDTT